MSNTILSLKWRPQKFCELEGQSSVQKILTNTLTSNSIHPALIFSGPKGTGKTSTARILAKALRCSNKNNEEPCGRCEICINVQNSQDIDVIEIDGASNNGVDAIRTLKESVQYMPSSGQYRVYIIDEVHMLSQSAFNALLKTLEEPPGHVIFIMATTEIKKIPSTVISRCQILNFRPIEESVIQKRLQYICEKEKIQIDEEALWLIVSQSQNSMRDAQVLLSQMASLGKKNISSEMVIQSLGLAKRELVNSILEGLVDQDTQKILSFIKELSLIDANQFLTHLLIQIRNLLMMQLSNLSKNQLVFLPNTEKKYLQQLAKKTSTQKTHWLFDQCLQARQNLIKSFDSRITLEMTLLYLSQCNPSSNLPNRQHSAKSTRTQNTSTTEVTHPEDHCTTKQAVKKEQTSFSQTNAKQTSASLSKNPHTVKSSIFLDRSKLNDSSQVNHSSATPTPSSENNLETADTLVASSVPVKINWDLFVKFLENKDQTISTYIKNFSVESFTEKEIVLGYPQSLLFLQEKARDKKFQNSLKQWVNQFFKKELRCRFVQNKKDSIYTQKLKEKNQQLQKDVQKAKSEPLVQKITDLFQAQVIPTNSHSPYKNS